VGADVTPARDLLNRVEEVFHMTTNGAIHPPLRVKSSVNGLISTLMISSTVFSLSPARADNNSGAVVPTTIPLDPEPQAPKTATAVPLASPRKAEPEAAADLSNSAELQQVEAAMGRPMTRDYKRFSMIFMNNENRPTFARYLYDGYARRRRSGVILAGVVAPILAGFTVIGVMGLYSHGKRDGGGFCNDVDSNADNRNDTYYSDENDDYYRYEDDEYDHDDCDEDLGELLGIMLISALGGSATIAVLIPGIVKMAKYSKRLNRLSPLVSQEASTAVTFSYSLNPGYLAAGFRF
jgi:hypothetical protein